MIRRSLVLLASGLLTGCADPGGLVSPQDEVASELTVISGAGQRFHAGRRSPEPFRVKALDSHGRGMPGVIVQFRVSGLSGQLSQPTALTDQTGVAESYLLDARPGIGQVDANSGSVTVALPVTVDRAPGILAFEDGTGETGVPGLPHPDSVLTVQVHDTEGAPMSDVTVWFAAAGSLSSFADTTDGQGRASVTLRRTNLGAGPGLAYAFIVGFEELTATTSRPVAPMASRVILVSVEGLRADAIDPARAPGLAALASSGAHLLSTTVLPSLSVPAHLSLWSGVSPTSHGIRNDTLRFTPQMASLDPIFKRAGQSDVQSVAWVSEDGPLSGFGELLSCRAAFGLDSLKLVSPSGRAAVDGALGSLANPDLDLLFVHVPDPDSAGHAFGFTSPEYLAAVRETDTVLADLVSAIDPTRTLLVITAPHGGGGRFGDHLHGSDDPADREVPLLLYGPGVVPGSTGQAGILDIAPTVLWALGMAPPSGYEGRVLLETFQHSP